MRIRFLLPLFALIFMAAASKPGVSIRFHGVADPRSGDSFTMPIKLGEHQITIERVPVVSEQDVVAVYPFAAPDGTMGCVFKLDENGRIKLDSASVEKKGSVLIVLVNSRVITAMRVDKRVTDGVISIGSGLTPEDIKLIQKRFRTLGQKTTFSRKVSDAMKNQ